MKQTAVDWLEIQLFKKQGKFNKSDIDQAKAMEKEQMINFADFVATYPDKNININGEMLHAKSKYDGAERTIDLLKEYYESNTRI